MATVVPALPEHVPLKSLAKNIVHIHNIHVHVHVIPHTEYFF